MSQMVNYWAKADEAFDRGQQAYLDWCHELAVLYSEGWSTQEAIADRYGKERVRITEAIAIGSDERFVQRSYKIIPKSKVALYLLTTLPDDAFEELCQPTTGHRDILAYKNRLAAPKVDKAEMAARHAEELAAPRSAAPLAPEYQAAIDEAQKATDTLKEFLKQFATTPRLTCKGNEYVLAVLNALAADLATNEEARKVFGRAIASMYHPDSGKVRKDHDLMSSWNAFVTQMEVK
jgi:hypothetical protein